MGLPLLRRNSNAVAARLVRERRHGVAFVGYLDPASPGHRLARVLLVFVLSSLGSAAGTFLAFHWLKDLI